MARVFSGVGTQPSPHIHVGVGGCLGLGQPSMGGTGEPNRSARQPFRHAQRLLQHVHGTALGGRAQNFPFATSSARRSLRTMSSAECRFRPLPGRYHLVAYLQAPTAATPHSAANHPPPVCLTGQIRTSGVGPLRGVALYLLSPSASPEQVPLYAAELDEHSLTPHFPISSRCGRGNLHMFLIPSLVPNSEDQQRRVHPTRARRFVTTWPRTERETVNSRHRRTRRFGRGPC